MERQKKEAWQQVVQTINWIFFDSATAPCTEEEYNKYSWARNNPLDKDIKLDVNQTETELATSQSFLEWFAGSPYLDVTKVQIEFVNHDIELYVNDFLNYFQTNYRSSTITHEQLESLIDSYAKHLAEKDPEKQQEIKVTVHGRSSLYRIFRLTVIFVQK